MNYDTFKTIYFTLPKNDARRIEAIVKYPGYASHLRTMNMKKLMEIRARKKETA